MGTLKIMRTTWDEYIMLSAKLVSPLSPCNSRASGAYHCLAGFCYHFKRRFWEGQMFNRLLPAGVGPQTITFSELRP
jgi:hypothetical protein